ncbi:hypothetical protein V7659_15115, partial [Neobacillus drentensis]|uniref:hypothetical protein n=1 Tax=Neobacillus drentensis TaxID=220684 RepID=UPI002FFEFADD
TTIPIIKSHKARGMYKTPLYILQIQLPRIYSIIFSSGAQCFLFSSVGWCADFVVPLIDSGFRQTRLDSAELIHDSAEFVIYSAKLRWDFAKFPVYSAKSNEDSAKLNFSSKKT